LIHFHLKMAGDIKFPSSDLNSAHPDLRESPIYFSRRESFVLLYNFILHSVLSALSQKQQRQQWAFTCSRDALTSTNTRMRRIRYVSQSHAVINFPVLFFFHQIFSTNTNRRWCHLEVRKWAFCTPRNRFPNNQTNHDQIRYSRANQVQGILTQTLRHVKPMLTGRYPTPSADNRWFIDRIQEGTAKSDIQPATRFAITKSLLLATLNCCLIDKKTWYNYF
jgi:hypothetical protein